jgi:quercetin dioxygenase-like cupin family protein
MPRSVLLPATAVLAALTAVALLASALLLRPPPSVAMDDATARANQAAAQRFYEAVNEAIASGDATALGSVLAPDYAEPDDTGNLAPGREALERNLRMLHEITPELRLEPDWLASDAGRVVARVHFSGGVDARYLGLALDAPPLWSAVDVFLVVDGRVAERSGTGGRPAFLEPLGREPFDLGPPGDRVVLATRVVLPPGGWYRGPSIGGVRLLAVEQGSLGVNVAEEPWQTAPLPEAEAPVAVLPTLGSLSLTWAGLDTSELAAGERLFLPDGAAFAVRNLGEEPAVLLQVLAATPFGLPNSAVAYHTAASGVATWVLAGGQKVAATEGPAALSLGRATLAPGGRLAWVEAPGPVLLVVEAGTATLATEGRSEAWVQRRAEGVAHYLGLATLAAGDGALIGAGPAAELRNAGQEPVEVLVVTLLPDAPEPLA